MDVVDERMSNEMKKAVVFSRRGQVMRNDEVAQTLWNEVGCNNDTTYKHITEHPAAHAQRLQYSVCLCVYVSDTSAAVLVGFRKLQLQLMFSMQCLE